MSWRFRLSCLFLAMMVVEPGLAADRAREPLNARILSLWDFNQPAQSEQRFRAAVAAATSAVERGQLRTQLARSLGLQRRFAEGHRELDDVELASPAAGRSDALQVRLWLERGRLFRSGGAPAKGKPLFEQAFERASQAGLDFLAVDAAHMMALVEEGDARAAWNERALVAAQASRDADAFDWQASLLNNIAWDLHDAGRAAEALPYFERAVAERRRIGQAGRLLEARWAQARCLRTLGRRDEALAIQRELEADMTRRGTTDGYVLEELGELLLAGGDKAASVPYFARAHESLSKELAGQADEAARLERLKSLAR